MTPPAEAHLWRWHLAALAIYTALSVVLIDHGESLTQSIAGQGSDPFAFIWFLAWWPWAISHHIDPLFTALVWQPVGVYLDWVTSVPLLAIIGWPLTLISPVLTFNLLILCAPVLSAWMAYFLCLRLTGRPAAAFFGGFLFGYSSYEMGQDTATLNLSFTMFVPTLLLIILLRLDGALSRGRVIVLTGIALICQFLLCIEIFGLLFVFGGMAWLLAMLYLPERRAVLSRLVVDGLLTAPIVILVLSPFLVSMFLHAESVNLPSAWPYYYSTDFLNIVVPSRMNLFGGALFSGVSQHFNGGIQEQDGYIGWPLLLIVFLFAREKLAAPAGRFLFVMFLILVIFSFGPRLWVGGNYFTAAMPWALFVHLPLVASALPVRFALFVSLTTAVMAVLWMAGPDASKYRKWRLALGGVACLALLPHLHPWTKLPNSSFFAPNRVEAVLGVNARVLILPFAINGPSSFWQAENKFGFAQTGGYLGFPPASMQGYAAVYQLFGGTQGKNFLADVKDFCATTRTQFIVVGPGTSAPVMTEIARLNWPEQQVDDVIVYTVPAPGGQDVTHG